MAKSSVPTISIDNPVNKAIIFSIIMVISLVFIILGLFHLNKSNDQSMVIINSNSQTNQLVRTIIVGSSNGGQTIDSVIESEIGPSGAPTTLQSNNDTGQSSSLQPNSSTKANNQVSTSPLQSNTDVNDLNIANSPLVQSVLSQ